MKKNIIFIVMICMLLLGACIEPKVQETVKKRNELMGERSAESNFLEAQQIAAIEDWKDVPGKIVNLYIFKDNGDLLIPPLQCMGVPTSSTESLEPNEAADDYRAFLVPVDGVDVYTYEQAGKDGTFGDPVQYRQCLTVTGSYIDFPAMGFKYIVTSDSYTFADATVKRDIETELRIKQAEVIIANGGCVDYQTLEKVECEK